MPRATLSFFRRVPLFLVGYKLTPSRRLLGVFLYVAATSHEDTAVRGVQSPRRSATPIVGRNDSAGGNFGDLCYCAHATRAPPCWRRTLHGQRARSTAADTLHTQHIFRAKYVKNGAPFFWAKRGKSTLHMSGAFPTVDVTWRGEQCLSSRTHTLSPSGLGRPSC